jgi:hypothetical protein
MRSAFITSWQKALQVKSFGTKCIISIILLAICGIVSPIIFQFIQQREGLLLHDIVLKWLPSIDLSLYIFVLLYLLILMAVGSLVRTPHELIIAVQAYIILTTFRFIMLLLVPLEPPTGIVELGDPLVEYLFYQQSITKDLFFSGHTSLIFLLALSASGPARRVLFFGTLPLALMLLVQHAHYTVDIVAAPVFAWLAFSLSKKIP